MGETWLDFSKIGEVKPISIFGPDRMVSRHPDIPDQINWMAYNHGEIERFEPYKRSYIVTPRKHGRSKAMLEEIAYNLRYGRGSVAYVGPGMTITERRNPWPVGTDAWHLWNLHGDTIGHAERLTEGPQGLEGVFRVYTPSQFIWDRQKAAEGVSTVLGDQIHVDSHVSIIDQWLPKELL